MQRIPQNEIAHTRVYINHHHSLHAVPLYSSRISAGYPTPAEDYIDKILYLSPKLVSKPKSTFLVIAQGDSMINAGIESGDILIVDQAVLPAHGHIVIAALDGELTVKYLTMTRKRVTLMPANEDYVPIEVSEYQELVIWGVVSHWVKPHEVIQE